LWLVSLNINDDGKKVLLDLPEMVVMEGVKCFLSNYHQWSSLLSSSPLSVKRQQQKQQQLQESRVFVLII
jgi:hypothetical protein